MSVKHYEIKVSGYPTRQYMCGMLKAVRLYLSEFGLHGEVKVWIDGRQATVVRDSVDTFIVGWGDK
jgi:hypothetical protein